MENNPPKPVSKHAKKITIAVVAIIVAVAIGASTFALLRSTTPVADKNQVTVDKAEKAKEAKSKYDSAVDSMKKGDTASAKKALEDAQALYKQADDTSHDKDIQASLTTLGKQPETKPASPPAASQPASN